MDIQEFRKLVEKDFEEVPAKELRNLELQQCITFIDRQEDKQYWFKPKLKFPIILEDLMEAIPNNYKSVYKEHFVLPYIKKVIKKDFDIDLIDNTHLKMILEKE